MTTNTTKRPDAVTLAVQLVGRVLIVRATDDAVTITETGGDYDPILATTRDEARYLARVIGAVLDRTEKMTEGHLRGFAPIAEVTGRPVEEVATALGIDLATATVYDVRLLAEEYAVPGGAR